MFSNNNNNNKNPLLLRMCVLNTSFFFKYLYLIIFSPNCFDILFGQSYQVKMYNFNRKQQTKGLYILFWGGDKSCTAVPDCEQDKDL